LKTPWKMRLRNWRPPSRALRGGEHNPSFPTLLRLSDALGIELAIDIAPTGKEPQLIGQRARRNALEAGVRRRRVQRRRGSCIVPGAYYPASCPHSHVGRIPHGLALVRVSYGGG